MVKVMEMAMTKVKVMAKVTVAVKIMAMAPIEGEMIERVKTRSNL
jgi:hypothetical protein